MDIAVILKVAGIGLLTSVSSMILESTGEKIIASKVITVAGIIVTTTIVLAEISKFIQTTVEIFHLY